LFAHLQDNHPEIYAELSAQRPPNQPTIREVIERGKRYDAGSRRAKELDHAVSYFLAKDMQPFYTVEKPGFQKMVSVFDQSIPYLQGIIFLRRKCPECTVR